MLARARIAILPVGATEQHGPHLRLETDTAIAEALAHRIAEAVAPLAVVAPPLPIGVSYHHMDFAGTLTVSPDTLQRVLTEMAESLHQHGITHFFLLSGHGGNEASLQVLATTLRFQRGLQVASLFYFALARDVMADGAVSERWGHACEVETSLALYLRPDLIDGSHLSSGVHHPYPYPYSDLNAPPAVSVPFSFAELTENGAFGDARQAEIEFGRAIAEAVVDRAAAFLRGFVAGSTAPASGTSGTEAS